jgi:hypothetical protein
VLVLEGDLYDSRNYRAEQLRTRVESFAEMLKMAISSQEGLISCLEGMELVAP